MAENDAPAVVGGLMQRKVFGVPVLVIALIFAAGLLWMAIRLKPADDPADVTEDGDVPEGDITDAGLGTPIFIANPPPRDDTTPDVPDAPQEERTDADWARDAIGWLVAGGASVSNATAAINGYLSGAQLSMSQGVLRDKAIKQFGPPPSGYLDTKTSGYNGPAVKQGNPPTRHKVRGKSDDTVAELSRLYYGMESDDTINYLRAANPSLPTRYRVGQVVVIPRYRSPKYYKTTQRVNTLAEIARKNGTTPAEIANLNPDLKFPITKVGTRVRVQ